MPYLKEQSFGVRDDESDNLASQEVESYIERVEKATEKTASDSNNDNSGSAPLPQQQPSPQSLMVKSEKSKIFLPVSQSDLQIGLKEKTSFGIKWLAEWCLMMIKKYPGRVFYSPSSNYD